jgi:hypothetical protein
VNASDSASPLPDSRERTAPVAGSISVTPFCVATASVEETGAYATVSIGAPSFTLRSIVPVCASSRRSRPLHDPSAIWLSSGLYAAYAP